MLTEWSAVAAELMGNEPTPRICFLTKRPGTPPMTDLEQTSAVRTLSLRQPPHARCVLDPPGRCKPLGLPPVTSQVVFHSRPASAQPPSAPPPSTPPPPLPATSSAETTLPVCQQNYLREDCTHARPVRASIFFPRLGHPRAQPSLCLERLLVSMRYSTELALVSRGLLSINTRPSRFPPTSANIKTASHLPRFF